MIRDRTYNFRTYRSVFVGQEAVDWMIANGFADTREAAVVLGKEMIQNGIFHHVTYGHTFKDSYLFYRFPDDDPLRKRLKLGGPSVATLMTDCGVTKAGWVLRSGTLFWNRRYLVVKQDESKLYYFSSNLDPAPKFAVELTDGITVKEEVGSRAKKGHYCFTIFSAESSLTFACEKSADQESWLEALIDAGTDQEDEALDDPNATMYNFSATTIEGQELSLSEYKGLVCLVVNVATK